MLSLLVTNMIMNFLSLLITNMMESFTEPDMTNVHKHIEISNVTRLAPEFQTIYQESSVIVQHEFVSGASWSD